MTSSKDATTTLATNEFTKIDGKPTAMDIALLEKEAFEFAGTMENSRTHRFGHAGMLMDPEAYQIFVAKAGYNSGAWSEPRPPGNYPRFAAGDDKDTYRIKVDIWNMENTISKDFITGKKKLKQQFLNAIAPTDPLPPINGAINVVCNILRVVVSSAAEAEMAGLFHNAKEASALRITLQELGHEQPPTPLVTDNSTASGIVNDTVKQKQSKAMDMRFYWIKDRAKQGEFCVFWRKGSDNRADYFTKDHPASHHQDQRQNYVHLSYKDEVTKQEYYLMSANGVSEEDDEIDHLALFYACCTTNDQEPQV